VASGARLQLENQAGDVTIRTWGRNAVRVQARHSSRQQVEIEARGSLVQIDSHPPGHPGDPVRYTITVPAEMPIEVEVVHGSVDIAGTRAPLKIDTVNGDIRVQGGAGTLTVGSVQGAVIVSGARGDVTAETINQEIELSDISGTVNAQAVNGRIRMSRIDAGRVTGETVNGSVSYQGSIRSDGWYRFSTHNGSVDLVIPSGAGATFTASTFNGTLETGFPVTLREAREGKEFSFTLGSGGARIELESFNGTMSIRRSE
jgi:DUF4097 and DUF4098 domain-containing protein YvlB